MHVLEWTLGQAGDSLQAETALEKTRTTKAPPLVVFFFFVSLIVLVIFFPAVFAYMKPCCMFFFLFTCLPYFVLKNICKRVAFLESECTKFKFTT